MFFSKHSTITTLLECTHGWSLDFHGKLPVDVVYIIRRLTVWFTPNYYVNFKLLV